MTSWATSSFPTRSLVDGFRWSSTPICWRHVVSVSTQTDLLETCRVGVCTNAITVKQSPCVHIWRKKYLNILKTFTLKKKAGCFSEACWHSNTCTAFTMFRPLRTTRHTPHATRHTPHATRHTPHACSVVCLHCHILLSTFTTVYVPTQNINLFSSSFRHFKIERITRVSKARREVPVKDALIAYEFHFLLFGTHVGAYSVSVEGPAFLRHVRHRNPGNSHSSPYWFLPSWGSVFRHRGFQWTSSFSPFTGVTTHWILAFSVIPFHSALPLHNFLHPLIPILRISSSPSSIQLFLGLPLILLPVGFHCNTLLGVLFIHLHHVT